MFWTLRGLLKEGNKKPTLCKPFRHYTTNSLRWERETDSIYEQTVNCKQLSIIKWFENLCEQKMMVFAVSTTLYNILLYDTRCNHFIVTVISAFLWWWYLHCFHRYIFFLETNFNKFGDLGFFKHSGNVTIFPFHILSPRGEITICEYSTWKQVCSLISTGGTSLQMVHEYTLMEGPQTCRDFLSVWVIFSQPYCHQVP